MCARLWAVLRCVQAQGSATSEVAVVKDSRLEGMRYMSAPTCINKTIEWAGTIVVVVRTKQGTPVPGINVRRLFDSVLPRARPADLPKRCLRVCGLPLRLQLQTQHLQGGQQASRHACGLAAPCSPLDVCLCVGAPMWMSVWMSVWLSVWTASDRDEAGRG